MVLTAGANLLDIRGVGPLTAGRIAGETWDVRRFCDRNAFATANGTAPIPVSSGGRTDRYRLNRASDRRLNEAFHTVALVQIRADGPAREFMNHKKATVKTSREAMRSLNDGSATSSTRR